ncbi:MAG: M15 family metallopeptidase [Actinomycetota bacterium]|nr:M15 family metallopeptidase [Actinomycetota bacterium]
MQPRHLATVLAAVLLLGGCTTVTEQQAQLATSQATPTQPTTAAPDAASTSSAPPAAPSPAPSATTTVPAAPTWVVGATPLPLRPDGFGQISPTPSVLANRSLPTKDILPAPKNDRYTSTIAEIPNDVLARSTWREGCPVARGGLRYLTMSFWGFDGRAHTGEMIVNASVAEQVTSVFGTLFANRFPLEEMRVTTRPELDLHPTGDGNNTGAFVCRSGVNLTTWSAHAYGLAIDLNPFCNPYVKGNLVLPELASSYVDRQDVRPGMLFAGDPVVRAFAAVGWSWGGAWTSPVDTQHFTATGR